MNVGNRKSINTIGAYVTRRYVWHTRFLQNELSSTESSFVIGVVNINTPMSTQETHKDTALTICSSWTRSDAMAYLARA